MQTRKLRKTKGQSLVELAISLPLFLVLIAGIVEVGNLLVQRQRITTATDTAVRFGSRGGSDEGVALSTYAVLTQTMPIDDLELWDVFVIRGVVNDEGTGWVDGSFEVNSVYGGQESELATNLITNTSKITLASSILDALQTRIDVENEVVLPAGAGNQDGRDQAAGEEVIGVIMSYKAETILGIEDYFGQDVELVTEKYMTVHAVSDQTTGCDVYPIAVSSGVRNIVPGEVNQGDPAGKNYYAKTSVNYQPKVNNGIGDLGLYNYPGVNDRPHWIDFRVISGSRTVLPDDQGQNQALEGDIYVLEAGTDFEWVFFGDSPATSRTSIDMEWPGNSRIYDAYNSSFPDSSPGQGLHIGDRIKHATNNPIENNFGRAAGAFASLEPHIDVGRAIRIPVINFEDFNTTSDNFKIAGFIIVKILGHGTSEAGNQFIIAEVVKYDTSCGQVASR
ncbi:MAG: TadE/TadG family type IV pilus assembly protein [Anaerolineae bacterium]